MWTGRGKGARGRENGGRELRKKWGEAEKRGVKQRKEAAEAEIQEKARQKMEAWKGAVRRPSRAGRGDAADGQRKGGAGQTRG